MPFVATLIRAASVLRALMVIAALSAGPPGAGQETDFGEVGRPFAVALLAAIGSGGRVGTVSGARGMLAAVGVIAIAMRARVFTCFAVACRTIVATMLVGASALGAVAASSAVRGCVSVTARRAIAEVAVARGATLAMRLARAGMPGSVSPAFAASLAKTVRARRALTAFAAVPAGTIRCVARATAVALSANTTIVVAVIACGRR